MRNCNDILKALAVKSVSESLNPEKLSQEKGKRADNRRDIGKGDFKSIVRRNMGKEDK